jgi:CRP-like cAMP-binding protein
MPATKLREATAESPSLHAILLRYVQAFTVQTAHTAIANARGSLLERLARWLLMAHDRVQGDKLNLTHEFLSLMMAVRRAGVTEALQHFEDRKLIECTRGQITMLNRQGIEKIAGHYYGVPEREYRRLIG